MLILRQGKLIPSGFNVYFRCYMLHCGFSDRQGLWGGIGAWKDYRTGGTGGGKRVYLPKWGWGTPS